MDEEPSKLLGRATVVLVATSHPGNLGAAARAMAVMGLSRMALAGAQADPDSADAVARASGCEAILKRAARCADLAEAIADCQCAYGYTGRRRNLSHEPLDPRAAAAAMRADLDAGKEIAMVFGNEQSGLSNSELDQCDRLVAIPTASASRSLNLAAAVQVACYELLLAMPDALGAIEREASEAPTKRQLADLLQHLEETIGQCCPPATPGQLARMVRRAARLLGKAAPDAADVRMLRGLATSVQKLHKRAKS